MDRQQCKGRPVDGPHDLSNIPGKKGLGAKSEMGTSGDNGHQAQLTWAPAAQHTVSWSRRPLFWERFLGACAISQAEEKTASGGGRLPQSRG